MHITKAKIRNYRSLDSCDIDFRAGLNILVGDNEAGKSTLLEAISLALTGSLNGRPIAQELHPYLFSAKATRAYLDALHNGKPAHLPAITIELFFSDIPKLAAFRGDNHSEKSADIPGILFSIEFNDAFKDSYSDYIAEPLDVRSIPVEYYHAVCQSFSRKPILSRDIPLSTVVVDASRITTITGANRYVTGLIREALPRTEQVQLSVAYRKLRELFLGDASVGQINKELADRHGDISEKTLTMTLDPTARGGWEAAVMPSLDDIPITLVGKGEQNTVKIKLALENGSGANVFLIEEPENHLSYSRLHGLISAITKKAGGRQLIITTHSSFVLNKLGINNVILFKNGNSMRLDALSPDTYEYFRKLPGHDTLRLLLSDRSILVEGPSDELVVQKAFIEKHGVSPLEKGVDIISVRGLAFKRFLEIARLLGIKTDVVTDNDGDVGALQEKYADYLGGGAINIRYDLDEDYKTLELQMLKANSLDALNKVLGTDHQDPDQLIKWMTTPSNKTDVALKVFDTTEKLAFPAYINAAVE
ncbi:ATP-dependent nuclease [Bradyrhizobium sp. SYSU BS000235]|uniref:ATP-dependent nuclease n=1 Tax=Bradyrhizobium sp. SYSU BS000235 TaxID=3411332 RepID=UPI003C74A258